MLSDCNPHKGLSACACQVRISIPSLTMFSFPPPPFACPSSFGPNPVVECLEWRHKTQSAGNLYRLAAFSCHFVLSSLSYPLFCLSFLLFVRVCPLCSRLLLLSRLFNVADVSRIVAGFVRESLLLLMVRLRGTQTVKFPLPSPSSQYSPELGLGSAVDAKVSKLFSDCPVKVTI